MSCLAMIQVAKQGGASHAQVLEYIVSVDSKLIIVIIFQEGTMVNKHAQEGVVPWSVTS